MRKVNSPILDNLLSEKRSPISDNTVNFNGFEIPCTYIIDETQRHILRLIGVLNLSGLYQIKYLDTEPDGRLHIINFQRKTDTVWEGKTPVIYYYQNIEEELNLSLVAKTAIKEAQIPTNEQHFEQSEVK